MKTRLLLLALLASACSSAPRIDSVELTRSTLRIGEEGFLTVGISDDDGELNPPSLRITVPPFGDEEPLESEVELPSSPEGTTTAQVIVGLRFTGDIGWGSAMAELVLIDSGGSESEPWPLSLGLTF